MKALWLSAACALCGAAYDTVPSSAPASAQAAGPRTGWVRMAKSLLYYDSDGSLANEIGLGRWEDSLPTRIQIRAMDGGTSADGRFAWTLDKRTTWNTTKTKVLDSQRTLRFFDTRGQELWSEDGADTPSGSAPLVSSGDGQTLLLALRRREGWSVEVKTDLGNTRWAVGPFPDLELVQISTNGLYGLARWRDPDRSAVHSFLDLATQRRQDVPSERFFMGQATIDDQGRASSAAAPVFSFTGPSLSTAPTLSTQPAASPQAQP